MDESAFIKPIECEENIADRLEAILNLGLPPFERDNPNNEPFAIEVLDRTIAEIRQRASV